MVHLIDYLKTILIISIGVITFLLVVVNSISCVQGKRRSINIELLDNGQVISDSGVSLRIFDDNGIAITNPSDQYKLDVTQLGKTRQVVVSLKREISTRSSYLEVRFDGTREHPTEIKPGSALMQHKPLVYTGSPESGMVISAQIIPGEKKYEVNGELLRFDLVAGSHQVRTVSAFTQDPIKDPIITDTSIDLNDKRKIFWTYKLRGDGNCNQKFDFADFGVIGAKYKLLASEFGCEIADADGKGKIDFADLGIIGANYNKGIGGLKIYRDEDPELNTLLGIIDTSGIIKADFTLGYFDYKILASGFKKCWYTFEKSGRYLKLVLIDINGDEVSDQMSKVDTKISNTDGAGDWKMFGREASHKRCSPILGPKTNAVKWTFTTDAEVISSPCIGLDGVIYFGSNDKNLYAVNPDGSLKWKFQTGGEVISSPAISENGIVYVGSKDNKIYAIYPDGTQYW